MFRKFLSRPRREGEEKPSRHDGGYRNDLHQRSFSWVKGEIALLLFRFIFAHIFLAPLQPNEQKKLRRTRIVWLMACEKRKCSMVLHRGEGEECEARGVRAPPPRARIGREKYRRFACRRSLFSLFVSAPLGHIFFLCRWRKWRGNEQKKVAMQEESNKKATRSHNTLLPLRLLLARVPARINLGM